MGNTLEILEKLVGFPTVSSKTNLPMIEFIRTFLVERGFEVHQIDDPGGIKAGLFATIGPKGEGGTLLSAHTDVVPVEGQNWTRDPFQLSGDGERVFGRGTTDMKGYLASVLDLADKASRQTLSQPLKLSFSYDEEIGCVGIRQMIDQLVPAIGKPAMCIVGEPTSMQVATGHKGKAAFNAKCIGENGHSSMAPNFVNALHVAADFIVGLRKLQDVYSENGPHNTSYDIAYSTLHVGKMAGGTALNMVPASAEMVFEYRHVPEHDPNDIEYDLGKIVERINTSFARGKVDEVLTITRTNSYPGLNTSNDSDVVSLVCDLAQAGSPISVPFGTEAGFFDGIGIPTVVCGPGSMDEQGHKPDESIGLVELEACDRMHERLLNNLIA